MGLLHIRKRLWQILEKGNEKDKASVYTDIFLITLIILNIVAVVLETVDSIYNVYKLYFIIFERVSTFIFLIEYIMRVWVSIEQNSSKKKAIKGSCKVKIYDYLASNNWFACGIIWPTPNDFWNRLKNFKSLKNVEAFKI